jgi:hypothetical protein
MITRNPFQRLAEHAQRQARQSTASVSANQGATGSSGPETGSAVGTNDPVSGALVLYGILNVTLASACFRLKNG